MKRRAFITLLGGAAATWPLVARAQQPNRMRRIGVLMYQEAADDPEAHVQNAAFLQALQQLGWTVGGNVRIEYRWGGSDAARLRTNAAEIVALAPDVILASGGATIGALQQATRTVPVVFLQTTDPDEAANQLLRGNAESDRGIAADASGARIDLTGRALRCECSHHG